MRSKITTGEVPVSLDEDELVLRPTLRAMTQLSRTYGGLAKVRAELVAENIDAMATVLRLGCGMNDRDAKDLGERIYRNGVTAELLLPLIRYVAILGNGGKPLDEDEEDGGTNRSRKGEDSAEGNV